MKTIFILSAFLCSTTLFAQSEKRFSELKEKMKISYYAQNFSEMDLDFYAKKYVCLEKKYKINPIKEKEFLTEKEFKKRYPDYLKEEDRTIENSSTLQEALKNMHFNPTTNKHDVFPKCIKKEDL